MLLTGSGICEPGIVDLADPGPPGPIALGAPGCAVERSPSGRFLATSTRFEPEGQPIVVLDTRDRPDPHCAPRGQRHRPRPDRRQRSAAPSRLRVHRHRGRHAAPHAARRRAASCGRIASGDAHPGVLQRDRRTLVDAATGKRWSRWPSGVRGELPVLGDEPDRPADRRRSPSTGDAAFTFLTLYDRAGSRRDAAPAAHERLPRARRAARRRRSRRWRCAATPAGSCSTCRPATGCARSAARRSRPPAVSPDGTRFAVATPQAIVFVDVATLAPQLAIPAQVRDVWWLDEVPAG